MKTKTRIIILTLVISGLSVVAFDSVSKAYNVEQPAVSDDDCCKKRKRKGRRKRNRDRFEDDSNRNANGNRNSNRNGNSNGNRNSNRNSNS